MNYQEFINEYNGKSFDYDKVSRNTMCRFNKNVFR